MRIMFDTMDSSWNIAQKLYSPKQFCKFKEYPTNFITQCMFHIDLFCFQRNKCVVIEGYINGREIKRLKC